MSRLKYLNHYPAAVTAKVENLLDRGELAGVIQRKYPTLHDIRSDKALYAYVMDLKNQYLRQSAPLSKIVYDDKLDVLHQALGLHSFVSRVQGGQLKAKNEIRIGAVFKIAPLPFLRAIAVHELAHLREKEHNKAFYKLCEYMEPDYHQLEFDLRLYLTCLEQSGPVYA
ncbi:M48 family metallopeptidase [Methylomonas koyamae]|uniref:Metal-dependent hydrolase n=1 Tax=Methylomonas koyamae TaxID=702114 RepID=A0A291IHW7_9GAMM|nr:M48 family metallopeptidase [Methylomonas koyamae]ATG89747.1 metal-dependent hydrolase [Methylomonas koyamae]OAI24776.1 metal-dependent hydrolase [Methylomonas koyamae]